MSEQVFTAGCHVDWRNDAYLKDNIYLAALQKQYGYGPFFVKRVGTRMSDQVNYAEISTEDGLVEVITVFLRVVKSYESPAHFLDPVEIATD